MMEWAALTPQCRNQAFNCVNGDFPSYARLWPALCAMFGLKAKAPEADAPNEAEVGPFQCPCELD
jgi:hypothetical protein